MVASRLENSSVHGPSAHVVCPRRVGLGCSQRSWHVSAHLAVSAECYDHLITNMADNDKLHSPECASWVDWYGQIVCDANTLLHLANPQDGTVVITKPKCLPFDHVHRISPSLGEPHYTAIHFTNPTAPSFHSLHEALSLERK